MLLEPQILALFLVTAKPTDRRAILEEAAGISGLHVRRHEAELRLSAAENNLKRADELRRQGVRYPNTEAVVVLDPETMKEVPKDGKLQELLRWDAI